MSPISGGGYSSLSEEFINRLIESLSKNRGVPAYRYSQVVEGKVKEKIVAVPATKSQTLREVWIKNLSDNWLVVYWSNNKVEMIRPQGFYSDTADGGIELSLEGNGKVRVAVRSEEPINYNLLLGGKVVMFPVGVSLHIGTGDNFDYVSQSIQDTSSNVFDTNVRNYFDSELGVTGYKLAAINSFTPGDSIEFNVVIEGSYYQAQPLIEFQWLNIFRLGRLLFAVGSDVINPEDEELSGSKNVSGIIASSNTAGTVKDEILTVTPNFLNMIGRFVVYNPNSGANDTAIIKSYQPDNDPLVGGTFILEGF